MKVAIVTVGDEILIGQIVDTNSAWMGQELNLVGARVEKIISVGDTYAAIHSGLQEALAVADAVLITGGLGPTKDDITKKALADFFGVELVFHQPTFDRIVQMFTVWGRPVNEAHRIQCFLPANAIILTNKMGTAPGMWMTRGNQVVVSMPGVPYEMQYLMTQEVLPRLRNTFPALPIAHRTLLTVGEGESQIAETLADFESQLPPEFKLAYLPNLGQVRLRLTGSGPSEAALQAALDAEVIKLRGLLGPLVFGEGDLTLEAAIGELLSARGLFLATAESCTGGHIAHLITAVPGASAYFAGSVVAYANEVKMGVLRVDSALLEEFGAVSEPTARAMVEGGLRILPAQVVLAITGIAGPTGGSEEKPVGTAWLAVGNAEQIVTQKIRAGKDRLKNIQYFSVLALNLLRKFLLELPALPGQQE